MLRKAMDDLKLSKSSFKFRAIELNMPLAKLFQNLSVQEMLLAVPSRCLVNCSVNQAHGFIRAAKREKCKEALVKAVGDQIGPPCSMKLETMFKKSNKALSRPLVTRILFIARVAVVYQFECDVGSSVKKAAFRSHMDASLLQVVRVTIDLVHAALEAL